MSKNLRGGLLALSIVASALSVQSVAHAGVSNPDYYFIDVPGTLDSVYDGGSGGGVFRLDGQLEGDLASDGSWTFGGASFTDVLTNVNAGGYVSARPIVVASGTYGTVDPDVPIITLTLRIRIKITGTSVGATCQTSLFTVTLSTAKSFLSQSGSYSVSTGQFLAGAQDFTVPAITSGCGGYETTLNNAFGFGTSSGNVAMKFDTASIATMLGQVPAR
jgi:hypothetical protein